MLDFNWNDFKRNGWGRVYLTDYKDDGLNQQFEWVDDEIRCKGFPGNTKIDLRLEVSFSKPFHLAEVGINYRKSRANQKWKIKSSSLDDSGKCSLYIWYMLFALGLGRATFFLARVRFRAFGFGPGRARATGKVLRVDFGLEYFQFGPSSGQLWQSFLRVFLLSCFYDVNTMVTQC